MNLRITIPPELEQTLKLLAAAAGKDVETYVVESLQESLSDHALPRQSSSLSFVTWLKEVRELIPSGNHFIDDSRESIYAGRGE